MNIRLVDVEFAHIPDSWNGYDKPKYIQWDRSSPDSPNAITVFTTRSVEKVRQSISKIKIAMLIEPEAIHPQSYEFIKNGGHRFFDYVLTFQKNLLDCIPNGVRIPGSGSWCREAEWQIYPKTKMVSMVASAKRMTDGHRFRHDIIQQCKNKIDFICGHGYNSVENKIVAFRDFRYTIVVENSRLDYWFSEKLIDAFATGTVPIYWGCPSITDIFDARGILPFYSIEQLTSILNEISEIDYNSRLESVRKNFALAKSEYKVIEDNLYKNFFRQFDK